MVGGGGPLAGLIIPDPPPPNWRGFWPDPGIKTANGTVVQNVPQVTGTPLTARVLGPEVCEGYFEAGVKAAQRLDDKWWAIPNVTYPPSLQGSSPWYAWEPNTGKVCWMIYSKQNRIWIVLSKSPHEQPTFKEQVQAAHAFQ